MKKSYWAIFILFAVATSVVVVYFLQQPDEVGLMALRHKTNAQKSAPTLATNTEGWQIYKNDRYGFEIKYPQKEIKVSENHGFGGDVNFVFPTNSFQVIVDSQYEGKASDYLHLGRQYQTVTADGYYIYSVANVSVPNVAFVKKVNENLYIIEFQYRTKPSQLDQAILSTFKVNDLIESKASFSDWETYINKEYGIEFKYPANKYTTPEVNNGYIRIQNYNPNIDSLFLNSGEYYIEITSVTEPPCQSEFEKIEKTKLVSGAKVYFGYTIPGGDTGGIPYLACVEKAGSNVLIRITENDEKLELAHKILDSLKVVE